MPRPNKIGVDYFPLDCQLESSMEMIEAEHGAVGFMVIIKLWQMIYGEKGYFCEWEEINQKSFARKNGIGFNEAASVVISAITYGVFDEKLAKKGILTSRGIQKRFANMTVKRKSIELFSDLLLVPISSFGGEYTNYSTEIIEQLYFTKGNNSKRVISEITTLPTINGATKTHDKIGNNRESKQRVNMESKVKKNNILADDSDAIYLAKKLYSEHCLVDPNFLHNQNLDKTFQRWGTDIEKLIRIDGRTPAEIESVIIFSQKSDFWKSNILSGASLRDKFPILIVQSGKFSPIKSEPTKKPDLCPDCKSKKIPGENYCRVCYHDFVTGGKFEFAESVPEGFGAKFLHKTIAEPFED